MLRMVEREIFNCPFYLKNINLFGFDWIIHDLGNPSKFTDGTFATLEYH